MTTNGYLPYDDDTFEKNLGYHDGYTEGERERMEELVNENKEAFDAAIKQADDGQVTIAVRRQRDEHLLAEVSAAKNIKRLFQALRNATPEVMQEIAEIGPHAGLTFHPTARRLNA